MISSTIRKVASIGITVGLLLPSLLLAEESVSPRPSISPKSSQKLIQTFCVRLPQYQEKMNQRYADQLRKFVVKRNDRLNTLAKQRGEINEKLSEVRSNWETHSSDYFNKLMAKATTDAQVQTVTTFKSAVQTAVTARRTAVNNAVQAFRNGVDQALAERKTSVDQAVSKFKTSVDAAFTSAKADCAANIHPQRVRETLRQNLKVARQQLETDRQNAEKLKNSADTLLKTRRQAIEKAFADYRAALQKAAKDLKAVFPASPALSADRQAGRPTPNKKPERTPSVSPLVMPTVTPIDTPTATIIPAPTTTPTSNPTSSL